MEKRTGGSNCQFLRYKARAGAREQLAGKRAGPEAQNSWFWCQKVKRAEEMGGLGPVGGVAFPRRGWEGGTHWVLQITGPRKVFKAELGVGRSGRLEEGSVWT